MALSGRFLLLLVTLAAFAGTSEGQAGTSYATKCYPPPPTPAADDGDSAFRENLRYLLAALPSAAAPTGFASLHTAGGSGTDRAFVRGVCFGEPAPAPEPCRRCLSDAGERITAQCGDASRRAGLWDERCFLGYADGGGANGSSSSGVDDMGGLIYISGNAVPSPYVAAVRRIVALAQSLAPKAVNGSVATANTTLPASNDDDATAGNRTVRVVAQCARDRAAAECVGCLREASLSMAKSW